jgi:hypothetical protein
MADDKMKRGPQDTNRVTVYEDYEVAYWTDKLAVSADVLRDTVSRVGTAADAVEKKLKMRKR